MTMAVTGSPRFESLEIRFPLGMIPFFPKANNMRGAPTKVPRADEKVAPNRPARTMGGKYALSMKT